jgi:hypothetical protein
MRFTSDEPFRTLVVHFFHRFFDTDSASEESVPRTRLIQFLALITVLTPLLMILMIRGEQKVQIATGELDFRWLQAGIHYTFVCYAMAVMGLVMTFKWDSLFPDRRDYLILTALPISAKRLFAAKAVALGLVLALFALATNAVLIILVGFMEPRAFVGHVIAVLGASIFAALFFAALQGVLINLLTPSAFRRISPSVQMVAIALLTSIVLVMPLIASSLRPLARINSPLLDYFPPVWFLGIYESLGAGAGLPEVGAWAWRAVEMTALAALVVIGSYVVGYRRHSRKVLEGVDSNNLAPRWWHVLGTRALHLVLQTNAYQRAAFDFIGKISARSPKHRISAALYSGVGLALALSSLFVIDRRAAFPIQLSRSGALELPAALSFLAVAGWRATFGIPYELAANWVFQTTSRQNGPAFRKAIRKWLYVCRILPLYVLLAFFEFSWFDSRTAAIHVLFDLITTAFLIEALFFGFRKIPYTCDYLQNKLQLAFFAVVYLYAYTTYKPLIGGLKAWVSADPQHLLRFLSVSAIAFGAILIYRALTGAERAKFIYDEPDRAFQQLDLS